MNTADKRILRLIELLIFHRYIATGSEFCDMIGMQRQNLSKVKKGAAHFTPVHIEKICNAYNVNANWIFGTQSKVFNTAESLEMTEII